MRNFNYRSRSGDLTFATARIGMKVRCVLVPSLSYLAVIPGKHLVIPPQVSCVYHIRSIGEKGILLKEVTNLSIGLVGEPWFPFDSFNIIPKI
jgi:hypothetical protein